MQHEEHTGSVHVDRSGSAWDAAMPGWPDLHRQFQLVSRFPAPLPTVGLHANAQIFFGAG